VAGVIVPPGNLCPELVTQFPTAGGARGDLRDRCTEVVLSAAAGRTAEAQAGLQQMAPVQATGLAADQITAASNQFANISARLAALRGRAGGAGGHGLAREPDAPAAGAMLASLAPGTLLAAATPAAAAGAGGRLGVFVNGVFSTGDKNTTSREAGFDFDGAGVTAGVDYRVMPNLVLGVALGYASTRADFAQAGGSLDSRDFSGSLYGTFYPTDQLYVDGLVSMGTTDYSLDRTIRYTITGLPSAGGAPTTVDQTARGETDGRWYQVSFGGGYEIALGPVTVTPLGRVTYAHARVDGYRESIAGTTPGFGLNLDMDDQEVESLVTVLGAQASYAISTPIGVVVPHLRVEWVHEFLADPRAITARFVNDPTPDAGTTIRWDTDSPDRNFVNIGVGLTGTFQHGISAFLYYETVLGLQDVSEHRVSGGVRFTF
jgi:uncharacterized protein with beta-barrel porin domain